MLYINYYVNLTASVNIILSVKFSFVANFKHNEIHYTVELL